MSDQLLSWSHDMVAMYQAFIRDRAGSRRKGPRDDPITHLIAAEQDGGRLTSDQPVTTCILLLNAGHEATVHALGNGIKTVLESGLPVDALYGDKAAAAACAEEILRFDPPLHMFTRYAMTSVEIAGHADPVSRM
ncbi:MAG: cytochrome P450, partial [Gammaproteobacteria bacterium]